MPETEYAICDKCGKPMLKSDGFERTGPGTGHWEHLDCQKPSQTQASQTQASQPVQPIIIQQQKSGFDQFVGCIGWFVLIGLVLMLLFVCKILG